MPSRASARYPKTPWRAKRRRDGTYFFLGYYATKEEAAAAEAEFDKDWPSGVGKGRHHEG